MLLVKGGSNAASVLALGKSRHGQGFASGSLEIQIQQCTLHFRSQGFLSLKSRFTDSVYPQSLHLGLLSLLPVVASDLHQF